MDIKLGLNTYIEEAEEILNNRLSNQVEWIREEYGNMSLFTLESRGLRQEDFENHVSDLVLDIILEHHVLDSIEKKLDEYGDFLVREEKNMVADIAEKKIRQEDNYILEKERVREEIIRYIEEYPIIYLDGFIVFRLKNLSEFTESVIEQSIESLNLEKEYENFMNVLKYLADSGDIGYDTVRILFEEDGYSLFDEDGGEIDKAYFEDIVRRIDVDQVTGEDLLISTLLALSPEKILIHIGEHDVKETIDLIERIFENKVYYCYDCKNCIRKVGLRTK